MGPLCALAASPQLVAALRPVTTWLRRCTRVHKLVTSPQARGELEVDTASESSSVREASDHVRSGARGAHPHLDHGHHLHLDRPSHQRCGSQLAAVRDLTATPIGTGTASEPVAPGTERRQRILAARSHIPQLLPACGHAHLETTAFGFLWSSGSDETAHSCARLGARAGASPTTCDRLLARPLRSRWIVGGTTCSRSDSSAANCKQGCGSRRARLHARYARTSRSDSIGIQHN